MSTIIHHNDNDALIISMKDVCRMTSLSRTAIGKSRQAGRFTVEVDLGERRIGFVKTEVLAWIEERIAARRSSLTAWMAAQEAA